MKPVPYKGNVAVVGAGISGLCYSYFLLKLRPDISIAIFEKSQQPGGWINTVELNDNGSKLLLEKGPRTLRGVSDGTLLMVDILKQLNLESEVQVMKSTSIANRKWLLDPLGKLVQVPNSIALMMKFLTNDVTQGLVASIIKEPFRPASGCTTDESILSFIERRFGSPALANNIISAMMHGIYSGDVNKLSVNATLPILPKLEKEYGSITKAFIKKMTSSQKEEPGLSQSLVSYEELISHDANLGEMSKKLRKFPILRLQSGLQKFPRAVASYLEHQPNVQINYGSTITNVDFQNGKIEIDGTYLDQNFDHIRFVSGFKQLQKVCPTTDKKIGHLLEKIEYSTIYLANIFSKKKELIPHKQNGFGFLVPKRNLNPESLLGVIYDSDNELEAQNFFSGEETGKTPYHKITLMIGGHFFNTRGVPSVRANLRAGQRVLEEVLGVDLSKYRIIVRDESKELNKDVDLKEDDLLISYNVHHDCIPQYNVGFLENTQKISQWVRDVSKGGVSLGGPCMGKLGIPDCVMAELDAALSFK